jgi:hypothetical protein
MCDDEVACTGRRQFFHKHGTVNPREAVDIEDEIENEEVTGVGAGGVISEARKEGKRGGCCGIGWCQGGGYGGGA